MKLHHDNYFGCTVSQELDVYKVNMWSN